MAQNLGDADCARNPQMRATLTSVDGQWHLPSRMVDQARIAIAGQEGDAGSETGTTQNGRVCAA
jgi:hypothetical protein